MRLVLLAETIAIIALTFLCIGLWLHARSLRHDIKALNNEHQHVWGMWENCELEGARTGKPYAGQKRECLSCGETAIRDLKVSMKKEQE